MTSATGVCAAIAITLIAMPVTATPETAATEPEATTESTPTPTDRATTPSDAPVSAASSTTASALERWTTGIRPETPPGLEMPYLLLRLPQYLVELAFVPLMPVATVFERYKLFERFLDLVTNENGTAALLPVVDPFNNAGLGAGAVFLYNEPFGSQDRFIALGQIYPNRDRIFRSASRAGFRP